KPPARHETLPLLLDEVADRHGLAVALQRTEQEGLTRISYEDVRARADAVAARLARAGVTRGDRVLIAGQNHPAWPIAFFGILLAGATAVPLDPGIDAETAGTLAEASRAVAVIADAGLLERAFSALPEAIERF